MSIEAMKQALEALKMCRGLIRNNIAEGVAISSPNPFFSADVDNAITTLRTAIEQAEKMEPLFWYKPHPNGMYNGPIHNAQIGDVLHGSEEWLPLYTTPPAAPVQDDLAYREAVSLATWLFKKHFAHEEHYASGRVVWEPCDTTAGVISQIDNMVCGLVQPAAQRQWVGLTDEEIEEAFYRNSYKEFAHILEAKLREKNGGAA